jgi:hypothetical protein
MIEPTSDEILKVIVEDEMNSFKLTLIPFGELYHSTLKSYRNVETCLKNASTLLLYVMESWPILIHKRIKYSHFLPYIQKEVEIINKLNNEIEEANKIINNLNKESRKTFYHHEFSTLLYILQNCRTYTDYVVGRDYFTYKVLDVLDRKKNIMAIRETIKKIIKEFEPIIKAFQRKLIINNNYDMFYMGDVEKYSSLTHFISNAYDNSLLSKILEANNNEEIRKILKEYSPLQGLNRVLFSVKDKIIEFNIKSIREGKEIENLCLPRGSLAQRIKIIDKGKRLSDYIRKIYGEDRSLLYI